MARTNLTLQLDAEVIRRVRLVAARRRTSVSALATKHLIELADEDERYERARERARQLLDAASARGGRTWTREDIYDRRVLRG